MQEISVFAPLVRSGPCEDIAASHRRDSRITAWIVEEKRRVQTKWCAPGGGKIDQTIRSCDQRFGFRLVIRRRIDADRRASMTRKIRKSGIAGSDGCEQGGARGRIARHRSGKRGRRKEHRKWDCTSHHESRKLSRLARELQGRDSEGYAMDCANEGFVGCMERTSVLGFVTTAERALERGPEASLLFLGSGG